MSAIFGLMYRDGRPPEPELLGKMSLTLAQYGVDGAGYQIQGNAALGYRLARLTPEDRYEAQPLEVEEGVWLVHSGRIDNRKELARELGLLTSHASVMPDSAFIAHAWRRWGADCPTRLIGPFAFAVSDRRSRALFLARSACGQQPLHYRLTPEFVAFSSAPSGLFALPFVSRQIDFKRVADHLTPCAYNLDRSFYSGIGTLRPGQSLNAGPDFDRKKIFRSLSDLPPVRFLRDEDYVEAFGQVFDRAVEDSLRSSTPVGALLSGGLDSTILAASAAKILAGSGRELHTFTAVPHSPPGTLPLFDQRMTDESPFVQAFVRLYPNIRPHYISAPGRFFLNGVSRFFEAVQIPAASPSNRDWMEEGYELASTNGINVLAHAGRGNLTISWDGRYLLPELLRQRRLLRLLREARGLAKARGHNSTIKALLTGLMPVTPSPVWRALMRLRHPMDPRRGVATLPSPIGRDLLNDRHTEMPDYGRSTYVEDRNRTERLERYNVQAEIERGYLSMFGVGSSDPTNDRRVAEFCFSLPEDQCLRDGTDRWLARRVLSGQAPEQIRVNTKRGQQAADWLNRVIANRSAVLEELDLLDRCSAASYAVDLPGIRTLIENLPATASAAPPQTLLLNFKLSVGLMTARFLRWFESGV